MLLGLRSLALLWFIFIGKGRTIPMLVVAQGRASLEEIRKKNVCSLPCINGVKSHDSEMEESKRVEGGRGKGDLVAIDKGFSFELDELLRALAYVLGKNGLGIMYKVVLGKGESFNHFIIFHSLLDKKKRKSSDLNGSNQSRWQ